MFAIFRDPFSMNTFLHHSLSGLKRQKWHYMCFSVGTRDQNCTRWPPGARILHSHMANPHHTAAPIRWSNSKDENDDSERDGGASGGDEHDDGHDLCYCWQMTFLSLSQVKRSAADMLGYIRLTVGVLASTSGIGEITLSGMNVIGPQACHQHIGLQLFLDYIVKGSEEGSKNCMQFTGGCSKRRCAWTTSSMHFEQWHTHTSGLLKKKQGRKASLSHRSACFSPPAKNTLSPSSATTYTVKKPVKCHTVL